MENYTICRNKASKVWKKSLYQLCMLKIAEQFSILEHKIARLPYILVNDLHDNIRKFGIRSKNLASKVFINPGVTEISMCYFMAPIIDHELSFLRLINQPILSEIVNQICRTCKNVTTLNLIDTDWMDINDHIQLLQNFPQLKKLTVFSNCTDRILLVISKNCRQLQYLDLSNCRKITDSGIKFLCLNKNIQINYLDITQTNVTVNGCLKVLNTFKQLKEFKHYYWISVFEHLKLQMESTGSIQPYNIQMFHTEIWLNNIHFETMYNFFPKARRDFHLSEPITFNMANANQLAFCSKIESLTCNFYQPDLESFGHLFPNLKYLDIIGSEESENVQKFQPIQTRVPFRYLRKLHLQNVNRKDVFFTVLANCSNLRELGISDCHILTDDLFKDLIQMNPLNNLQKLSVSRCNPISTKSLLTFLDINTSLQFVHIISCSLIEFNLVTEYVNSNNLHINVF